MNDNELIVWLYQQKVIIKRYNVPDYQWKEIKDMYIKSKKII